MNEEEILRADDECKNMSFCAYCEHSNFCAYCAHSNYCSACIFCSECNSCFECNTCEYCEYSKGLWLSSRMIFCFGNEKDGRKSEGYQKNYRIFNKDVSINEYAKIRNS